MRRLQVLVLLASLTGCDRVFGLNKEVQGLDAPVDMPASRVISGIVTQIFVHRTADGSDDVVDPEPGFVGGLTMNYLTDDTQTLLSIDNTTGVFTFDATPGEPYRISIQANGDTFIYELQLSADTVALTTPTLHTPTAQFVSPTITITPPTLAHTPYFATLGEWAPGVLTMPFAQQTSFTTKGTYTLDPSRGDRALLLEYASAPSAAVNSLTSLGEISLSISNSDPVTANFPTMTPLAHTCARMVGDYDTKKQRLLQFAQPSDAVGQGWAIEAYETTDVAPTYRGLAVAYDFSDNTGSTATVANLTSYNLPLVASASVSRSRSINGFSFGSSVAVTYPLADPTGGCPATSSTPPFDSTVALASTPILDGIALDTDYLMIDRTNKSVFELSWTPTNTNVNGWEIDVDIPAADANGSSITLRSIFSDTPSIKIPTSIFTANTPYIITINAVFGVPNAAHGDFTTVNYPLESSSVSTYIFQVKG